MIYRIVGNLTTMGVPLDNQELIRQKWLNSLQGAKENAAPVDGLASSMGKLSIEEAYRVQDKIIAARLQKGQKHIGWKVGATSQSVMRQLKIHEPIYGCMTSDSCYSLLKKVHASDFYKLARSGRYIRKGEVVLTGSLTEFFFVGPHDTIDVSFSNLGSIHVSIGE